MLDGGVGSEGVWLKDKRRRTLRLDPRVDGVRSLDRRLVTLRSVAWELWLLEGLVELLLLGGL